MYRCKFRVLAWRHSNVRTLRANRFRLRLLVDLAQVVDAYLGVNPGRIEPGVSEQLLDAAQVRAVFHHVCGAAVPEQVVDALRARVLRRVSGRVFQNLGRRHRPSRRRGPADIRPNRNARLTLSANGRRPSIQSYQIRFTDWIRLPRHCPKPSS